MSLEHSPESKRVHFTELTDTLFDALSEKGISSAGHAIVYYILRHTEGWQQRWVALSLDEFMHGRKKANGERYDHGAPLKSPHTVYAAIEEVGLAGFILELDTHDALGTKSYSIQAYWLEQDRAKLAHLTPITTYQCAVSNGQIRIVEPQKPPVYQGITRGKPRKPHAQEPMQFLHRSRKDKVATYAKIAQVDEEPMQKLHSSSCKNCIGGSAKIAQVPLDKPRQEEGSHEGDNHRIATFIPKNIIDIPPSAGADAPVFNPKGEEQEEQPDLMALRVEYTTLSHQLAQLDANKQAGQWARLYKRVKAAEERLRQAEQTSPSPAQPPERANRAEYARTPESAKQQAGQADTGEVPRPAAEGTTADERQAQLHAVASDILYWKGGLKVLKQARLPKWRGSFQWQIEEKIDALQTEYARLRAGVANEEG